MDKDLKRLKMINFFRILKKRGLNPKYDGKKNCCFYRYGKCIN